MNKVQLSASARLLGQLVCCLLFIFWQSGCGRETDRQRGDRQLIDEAQILGDIAESTEDYLSHIRSDYDIEVVLSTIPSTGSDETLKEATSRLFTEWDVGRGYGGRGLLLMLSERDKEVRIEVGSALEHVFTDLFTGYIETKQLKSYYLSGQLEIGLLAVIEEIEARAQLMSLNQADVATISARDQRFLSGGGGADVDLDEFKVETVADSGRKYPAGSTPDEAWQTLIQSWRDKNRVPDIGVYTPVTRLIYRDFTNQPARRFEDDVRTWGKKPYEIIENGNYGVVFFGNKKGWENAPFLFCRTEEGWQFDMVHQRKIVRMGRAPAWGIERGEHPYIELLSRCPYWMGQDIPLAGDDLYSVAGDNESVGRIVLLEEQLQGDAEDFAALYELGRLYTLTSMGQKRLKLLNKARELQPDHPGVLKYLAIAHVDAHYQYETALPLLQRYVELRPEDPFGYFFLGYLHLMINQPEQAIALLRKGLVLDPENVYGLCKLARAHRLRGTKEDLDQAAAILETLQEIAPDHLRVGWLQKELSR
ncbi:MAG: TPM domain-containing protein [Desulfocapsaceae bacterium]